MVKNRIRAAKEVVLQKIGGDTVLFNPVNGFHFRLDPVTGRIWQLIAQKNNLSAVVAAMQKEYAVAPTRLRKDVAALVQALHATKFLNYRVGSSLYI